MEVKMKVRLVLLVAILSLLLASCSAQGGGWILTDSGKAHFAFNVKCEQLSPITVAVSGPFQFNDPAAGIVLHGELYGSVTQGAGVTCDQPMLNPLTLSGPYVMRPSGETGTFLVQFTDNGEPGVLEGDHFHITIWDEAPFTSPILYLKFGEIGGGNIQIQ
jgi:hypothetical protein